MAVADQLTFDLAVARTATAPATRPRCGCGAQLTAADVHHHRSRCVVCRQELALEAAAERDWLRAPSAARCCCERPAVIGDEDGPRCWKCGRRPAGRRSA